MLFRSKKVSKEKNKKLVVPQGWINLQPFPPSAQIALRRVSYSVAILTGAGGIFITAFGATQIRANASEWTGMAARYTEYRIIRTKLTYIPSVTEPTGTVVSVGSVIFACDKSGSITTPTTSAQVWALDDAKVSPISAYSSNPFKAEFVADDLEEQNYTPVGTNAVSFTPYVGVEGSATSNYGRVWAESLIEFRGAQ